VDFTLITNKKKPNHIMKVFVVCTLLALATLAFSQRVDLNKPALDQDMIAELNKDNAMTWQAGINPIFEGKTLKDVKDMLISRDYLVRDETIPTLVHPENVKAPDSFDSRQKWPKCIHPIRNQGRCGSCWAFAASEVLSDRYCIAGKDVGVLSPQYMVSCDTSDYGCQGGYLTNSWAFLQQTGIPTDACYPYTSGSGDSGVCKDTCADGSPIKTYQASSYYQTGSVENTMNDIMTHGPVESGFSVYQDFMAYKSGIYQHRSGGLLGGHAVKIVGWGQEGNLAYWIVANSWTENWGEKGFFRIVKGRNECGFESQIITGLP
jgi:cathepsin B